MVNSAAARRDVAATSEGTTTAVSGVLPRTSVEDSIDSSRMPADQRSRAWGNCTDAYDVFAEGVTRPFAEDAVRLVRWPANARVLDVAAGTGTFALTAADRAREVLATDFSMPMIERLESKCRARGIDNVLARVMDGQNLDLEDDGFDIVGSLFGLMFFPDHDRGLREMHRVLKPGGQAVVAIWAPPARVDLMCLLGEAAMAAMCDLPLTVGEPPWAQLMDPSKLPGRMRRAGFARAHVVIVRHVWAFDDVAHLAQLLPTMTPAFAELVEVMTEAQRATFFATLCETLADRQGDGPFALTSEGFLLVGKKAH